MKSKLRVLGFALGHSCLPLAVEPDLAPAGLSSRATAHSRQQIQVACSVTKNVESYE